MNARLTVETDRKGVKPRAKTVPGSPLRSTAANLAALRQNRRRFKADHPGRQAQNRRKKIASGARMAFCCSMDRGAVEKRERWGAVGTFVAWVLVYFWAVWLFKELLPDAPEQAPFESYWQQQMFPRGGSGQGASSPAAQEAAAQRAAEAGRGF